MSRNGKAPTRELAYGITSLSETKADAARLLELVRGHWSIENRLHWVKDVTFDEDRSQVRKRNAPQAMSSLRNLAISVVRICGGNNIAAALRWCSRRVTTVMRIVGVIG